MKKIYLLATAIAVSLASPAIAQKLDTSKNYRFEAGTSRGG